MANRAEAYDFSYFEDRNKAEGYGTNDYGVVDYGIDGSHAYQPMELPQAEPEPKIVELPKQEPEGEPEQRRRPKRNLMRMAAAWLCFGLIFSAVMTAVYSEVQLTELTEKINEAKKDLEEAKSLEVQLTMQAAQKMSDAEVERYATEQLGMGKVTGSQVVYLHVAQQDRGTVVQELGEGSWLDRAIAAVRGWFA